MAKRVRGYHYVRNSNGIKRRVYNRAARRATNVRRAPTRRAIRGFGDYYAKKGKSKALYKGMSPPSIVNTNTGFIVRHREFIGDVPASAAFAIAGYPLNPGLPETFPWLSGVAKNFEEWKPRGIIFEFKTTSSNAVVSTAANAALGTIVMATEYNPLGNGFGNKQQMENYQWAVSTDPSKTKNHMVETKAGQNPLGSYYIRTGPPPEGGDLRFYDIGTTYVASVGMQSGGQNVGELWISYEMELRKPRLESGEPTSAGPAVDHFNMTEDLTGIVPARPFGTVTAGLLEATSNSNLGGLLSGGIVPAASQAQGGVIPVLDGAGDPTGAFGPSKANTYYFPPGITKGVYQITYNAVYGTAGGSWNPTPVYTNCQAKELLNQNNLATQGNASATTSVSCMGTFFVEVTKNWANFTLTGTTGTYANPTWVDMFVQEMPGLID